MLIHSLFYVPTISVANSMAFSHLKDASKEFGWVRMGGTIPVSEVFHRVCGLETVFFSFSTADEDYHAPNEFFRLHRLYEGLEAWAAYWERLGAGGTMGRGGGQ